MNGMGRHVKNTVMNRKNLRPHRSDKAPIRGALRKDNKPCQGRERLLKCFPLLLLLLLDCEKKQIWSKNATMDVLHLDFRISENKLFLSLLLLLFLRLLATFILTRQLVQFTHPRVYELHSLFLCYIPNNLLQQQMARRPSTRQCVDSGHKLRLFII